MANIIDKDRRLTQRISCNINVAINYMEKEIPSSISALLLDLSSQSGRLFVEHAPSTDFRPRSCTAHIDGEKHEFTIKSFMKIPNNQYSFKSDDSFLSAFFAKMSTRDGVVFLGDRRMQERRALAANGITVEKRQAIRRLNDIWSDEFKELDSELPPRAQVLFRQKSFAYDGASVALRQQWLETKLNVPLKALGAFAEPTENYKGKIENLVGVAHVPIGVAGPIRVNGEHAKGDFYVPMAATEGVLVNSYTMGMTLITRSGGASVKLLADEMRISPLFSFENVRQAMIFVKWIEANFLRVKEIADRTTSHGRLKRLEARIIGRQVAVLFVYDTGDAMGLNMICKATDEASRFIAAVVHPQDYYLRSNFSSNKKISHFNMQNSYGKSLVADVVIPRKLGAVVIWCCYKLLLLCL